MKPVFVGIDPGGTKDELKTGGIVCLNEDSTVEHSSILPTNERGFDCRQWVKDIVFLKERYEQEGKQVRRLFIEATFQQVKRLRNGRVVVRPQQRSFAKATGAQEAMAYLLAADAVRVVNADTWRSEVGLVQYGEEDTWKKAAKEACLRLWPQNPEIAKHPGLADAALMALAARQESTKAKWRSVGR